MSPILAVREIRPKSMDLMKWGDYYQVKDWDILAVEAASARVAMSWI